MAEGKAKKLIYFESATLFQELIEKGQLRNLKSVKSNPYPKYCFVGSEKVLKAVSDFMATHDLKCDRSVDDEAVWTSFEENVIKATEKPGSIVTRNTNAVKRIIDEGYGYMLKRTCVDQYKKKCFIFYANDRVAKIKEEEDAKSRAKYEEQHAEKNIKKQSINMQMSGLIRKVMGGIK